MIQFEGNLNDLFNAEYCVLNNVLFSDLSTITNSKSSGVTFATNAKRTYLIVLQCSVPSILSSYFCLILNIINIIKCCFVTE